MIFNATNKSFQFSDYHSNLNRKQPETEVTLTPLGDCSRFVKFPRVTVGLGF